MVTGKVLDSIERQKQLGAAVSASHVQQKFERLAHDIFLFRPKFEIVPNLGNDEICNRSVISHAQVLKHSLVDLLLRRRRRIQLGRHHPNH